MSMFCYQCQEAAKNTGCTVKGVCGKNDSTANLQDALVYVLKGLSVYAEAALEKGAIDNKYGRFVGQALFATITNANFDNDRIYKLIQTACEIRDELKELAGGVEIAVEGGNWTPKSLEDAEQIGALNGILSQANEDVRSLRELAIYGLKGIAAYADHASVLGQEDPAIFNHMTACLASTTKNLSLDEMIGMVMKTGEIAVTTMALLDKANTDAYGNPEITEVNIGVGTNPPGILISGHDLKDLKELLEQTQGTGVDVYTHSEMLPAHYYPEFKKIR